jgi:hypothetical protein
VLDIHPISYAEAAVAVEQWHYSKSLPQAARARHRFGVWEDGQFIGALVYGNAPTPMMGRKLGLTQNEFRELVRVALTDHQTPTTRIVAIGNRLLAKEHPEFRLLVSYADTGQGHSGTIYRAGNWLYAGMVKDKYIRLLGEIVHPRTVFDRYRTQAIDWLRKNVDPDVCLVPVPPKHRYYFPLDEGMRERLQPFIRKFASVA